MTLVELLVAVVIAVLLIAVIFSTYRTASVVTGGQKLRAAEAHAAAAALEQAQNDLMRAFIPSGDDACAIVLTQAESRASISFCMMEMPENESDLRWARAESVAYRVEHARLLKIARPLTGPGSADGVKTNALAEGVDKFAVQLFDGFEWQDHWPVSTNVKPRAAKLEIATTDKKSWSTEIWIPAGTVITSSIRRAAVVAP